MMMVMPRRPVKQTFRLGLPYYREVRPSAWADPVEELHVVTSAAYCDRASRDSVPFALPSKPIQVWVLVFAPC